MGSSLPPPAGIDLIESAARRRGADVEIILGNPALEQTARLDHARLARAGKQVRGSAELTESEGTRRLVVRAPRRELTDGTWSLSLVFDGDDRPARVDARLLVQGERPLVLLWGATGRKSRLATPHRRSSSARKVAEKGGATLDRVLVHLPEDQAVKLRAQARRIARKVLR